MAIPALASWLQQTFAPLLGMLDVSTGLDPRAVSLVFLLILIGEANIAVPLLLESVWLLVGYHSGFQSGPALNTVALLLVAQAARQTGIFGMFHLFPFINKPLKVYLRPLQGNRLYRKYASNDYLYNVKFLSLPAATIAMMTPLCGATKFLLILKRKLRLLLIGTLLSGMAFDACYVILGAAFNGTQLNMAYLPAFLGVSLIMLLAMKLKTRKARPSNATGASALPLGNLPMEPSRFPAGFDDHNPFR